MFLGPTQSAPDARFKLREHEKTSAGVKHPLWRKSCWISSMLLLYLQILQPKSFLTKCSQRFGVQVHQLELNSFVPGSSQVQRSQHQPLGPQANRASCMGLCTRRVNGKLPNQLQDAVQRQFLGDLFTSVDGFRVLPLNWIFIGPYYAQ